MNWQLVVAVTTTVTVLVFVSFYMAARPRSLYGKFLDWLFATVPTCRHCHSRGTMSEYGRRTPIDPGGLCESCRDIRNIVDDMEAMSSDHRDFQRVTAALARGRAEGVPENRRCEQCGTEPINDLQGGLCPHCALAALQIPENRHCVRCGLLNLDGGPMCQHCQRVERRQGISPAVGIPPTGAVARPSAESSSDAAQRAYMRSYVQELTGGDPPEPAPAPPPPPPPLRQQRRIRIQRPVDSDE